MSDPVLGLAMLGLIVVAIMMGFPTAFTLMGLGMLFGYLAFWTSGAHWWDNRVFDLIGDHATTFAKLSIINGNGGYYDGLFGDDGNDTITGGDDFMGGSPGPGADTMLGGDGNNLLYDFGRGDVLDVFYGGGGNDIIIGGAFAGTNDTVFENPFGVGPRPPQPEATTTAPPVPTGDDTVATAPTSTERVCVRSGSTSMRVSSSPR